jgi:gamma-glutamyltranspeptidase/glutathione hydrolase|tara:strand:- start:5605 stop:7284 length:1680 start_codon:yes stop_codon:yes gene_type:complete
MDPTQKGIVVAKHPLAVQAGASILAQGGNAFDSAVAVGFALSVVEPYMSGIGGGKYQLVFRTASGATGAIDAPVVAPAGAIPGSYEVDPEAARGLFGFRGVKGQANEIGSQAIAVPGVLAGLCLALQRYGSMPLVDVMDPAINFAENGYPLSWQDIAYIAASYRRLASFPSSASIFLNDGQVPEPSFQYPLQFAHILKQHDLGRTLRLIASNGPDIFYKGSLARIISEEVKAAGGWLSLDDLASYKASEIATLSGKYHGWDIVTGPDFQTIEALAILEKFNLAALGHNSVAALHLISQACLLAHSTFYDFITSPECSVPSLASYLDAGHIEQRASMFQLDTRVDAILFPDEKGLDNVRNGSFTTTGYSTADQWGNIVSVLQTHGFSFGSGMTVPGTGVLLNDQMLGFNPEPGTATSLGPGKRRPIPGWPIICVGPNGNSIAVASPGGNRVLCALVQTATNVIDFGMHIDSAVAAPRIDCGSTPVKRKTILASCEIDPTIIQGLEELGHSVEVASTSLVEPGGSPLTFAQPGGLEFSASDGMYLGGNDPYVSGGVVKPMA